MSIQPAEFDYSEISSLSNLELVSLLDRESLILINNAEFHTKKDLIKFGSRLGTPVKYSLANFDKSYSSIEDTLVRSVQYKTDQCNPNFYTNRAVWHIDSKWTDPQYAIKYNFLYSVKLPNDRLLGATTYVSTPQLLRHMDAERLAYLRTLTVKHIRSKTSARFEAGHVGRCVENLDSDFYVKTEPLIQKDHLGNEYMFLSPQDVWCIENLNDTNSEHLINQLVEEIKQCPYRYTHHWKVNQLLINVNTHFPHMVADDFDANEREMWRLWLK